MSIFVDHKETFPIQIHYQVFRNDEGKVTGLKPVPDGTPDSEVLICNVRGCDHNTMSKIMEQATVINHYTGKPVVRSVVFFRLMILNFFVSWNAKGKDGRPAPINDDSVNAIHDKMARALVSKYLKTIGGRQ